jgi:hypothetical protein
MSLHMSCPAKTLSPLIAPCRYWNSPWRYLKRRSDIWDTASTQLRFIYVYIYILIPASGSSAAATSDSLEEHVSHMSMVFFFLSLNSRWLWRYTQSRILRLSNVSLEKTSKKNLKKSPLIAWLWRRSAAANSGTRISVSRRWAGRGKVLNLRAVLVQKSTHKST